MEISQGQLALLYLYACLLGMGFGLFYDGLRIVRIFFGEHFSAVANRFRDVRLPLIEVRKERKKHGKLLAAVIFIEDFLFCLVAAVCLILLFYQVNNGKIRFLTFPLAGVGFYLYRITLGRLVMLCSETAAFLLEVAVRYLWFFVLFPWKWTVKKLIFAVRSAWRKQTDKSRKRERARFTESQIRRLDQAVNADLLGEREKKGVRRDAGEKEEAVQSEPAGESISGGHRGGVSRRIRQQRHEVQ